MRDAPIEGWGRGCRIDVATIPITVRRILHDGSALTATTSREAAADTVVAQGFGQVQRYVEFVAARQPEALRLVDHGFPVFDNGFRAPATDVRRGLLLLIDDNGRDLAHGGSGGVTVGRGGGVHLRSDPLEDPAVMGHELTHALDLPISDPYTFELDADLVGLAFARAQGHRAALEQPWKIQGVRDLLHPQYPTLDALVAASPDDFHVTAGPIGAAIARTAQRVGVAEVDRFTTEAVLRPPSDAADRLARLVKITGDGERLAAALTAHARHLLSAAERTPGRGAAPHAALAEELRAGGLNV